MEKVEDALRVGQVVDAKVLELDLENKRISLSIKELLEKPAKQPAPAEEAEEKEEEEDIPVVHEEISATLGDFMNK